MKTLLSFLLCLFLSVPAFAQGFANGNGYNNGLNQGGGTGSGTVSSGTTNKEAVYTGSTTVGSGNITDNGNIGIGSTNPGQALDVNGTVRSTYFSTSSGGFIDNDKVFNVKQYGALGNGIIKADGVITSGLNAFSSATATFTLGDVGKVINISRAGSSGGSLSTTIATFVDANDVTLTANAGTTATGNYFVYGTDDTTAIQNAINDVGTHKGGTVFFPEGIYIINGVFQNSGTSNTQLLLPDVAYSSPSQQIKLKGSYATQFMPFYSTYGSQNISGSMLFFTKLGASGTNGVALYDASGAYNGLGGNHFSNILVQVEDLTFETGTNPGPSILNLTNATAADVRNVNIQVNDLPTNLIVPTISTSSGLVTPTIYNHVYNHYNNVFIYGFYTCLTPNEHTDWDDGGLYYCSTGISMVAQTNSHGHLVHVKHMSMESVKNDIVWTGGASQLQIDHLDMENGSGIWVGTNLYDNSNYGYGTINYNIENGTGQASWTGGTHMHFKNTINGLDTEIGGNIGISTQFPGSRLSVGGNEAVGIAYATNAAPTNGLIVQGNVGIGSPSPGSQLDVNGTLNIRLGISSGNVGIGTGLPSPGSSLTIGGKCLGLSGDMYLNASGQVCVCTAGTFPACSSSTCC